MGWRYREQIKTAKKGGFCEELLSENAFEAVLATFCCYDYGTNACGAVQKIAVQIIKMLLVCYSLENRQNGSINNCDKRLVTSTPPT